MAETLIKPSSFTRDPFDIDKVRDQIKVGLDIEEIRRQVEVGKAAIIDSETCGLHSMMVLWQFAIDDGPIYLYHIWKEPVWKTLELFELLMQLDYIGFNLAFDHFHVSKIYTIWSLLPRDWVPEDHIEEIAVKYEKAGQDGPCIKPKRACDLMLWSRKDKFQVVMARSDIRIRRVPTVLAYALAQELEKRVELPGICFAKSKNPDAPKWKVYDRKDRDGNLDDAFKDVCLRFNPAGGLKFLAEYALGWKPKYHFSDVEVDRRHGPPDKKLGFIPTALGMAPGGPDDNWNIYDGKGKLRGHAWPYWIKEHIEHWYTNEKAQEYAYDDIVYTRALGKYFDNPEPGDDDSELACMVASVRWHGFETDTPGIKRLCLKAMEKVKSSPVSITHPSQVRKYIQDAMDETEGMVIEESTKKAILQGIVKMCFDEGEHGHDCTKCEGRGWNEETTLTDKGEAVEQAKCARCDGAGQIDASEKPEYDKSGGIETGNHPAAKRARVLLDVKAAAKEVELYSKLIMAGKFHPDFNVIGTLSTRMSGGSGLNAQGIKHSDEVRRLFPLKWAGKVLSGGDFDSFEVVLACAVYNDPDLFKAITEKVEHEDCPHGKTCRKCNGCGKAGDFQCMNCIVDSNGKATGEENCKVCGGKGWYRRKIHALFGMAMYPGKSYEDIIESSGTSFDMYTRGKSGVFGLLYGGDWRTLVRNFGITEEEARNAEERFFEMFPGIPNARMRVVEAFQSMKQIDGRQIIWREPSNEIVSFLGFRRDFSLENNVCKALYDLAKNPPREWKGDKLKVKVVRSMAKGVQSAGGAVASALFGAAFGLQAGNTRAAANHEIQSPGGQITKHVQRKIWDLQPTGVHELVVAPMNIHDEIMVVNDPDYTETIGDVVKESVESYRDKVPLIGMTWNLQQDNWADKKGGTVTLKITPPEMQ